MEFKASVSSRGKENFVSSNAVFNGSEILCPVSTSSSVAISEEQELRAYKLGKQKCSYNQVELLIKNIDDASELKVSEAIEAAVGNEVDELLRESCLKFNVRFVNNTRISLYIYVVYASPYCSIPGTDHKQMIRYLWVPVTRSKCRKGCKGPVIRGLQRFGKMSRRGNFSSNSLDQSGDHQHIHQQQHHDYCSWKEPRHLYVAIDEASTHVCPRPHISKFRLLAAAYDDQHRLLGSTVSSCIRVLANNDAPLGAASFQLHCHIKGVDPHRRPSWPFTLPNGRTLERRQCGRVPLQADIIRKDNPSSDSSANVIIQTDQESIATVETESTALEAPDPRQSTTMKAIADEHQSTNTRSPCSGEISAADDQIDSLCELCQRVFEACSRKAEGVITLRKFATLLGANRNSLLEIFDVLKSVEVVEEQGKEKYVWFGSSRIQNALEKLKVNAVHTETANDSSVIASQSCSSLTIVQLSKQFCSLLLANSGVEVQWDSVVTAILDARQCSNEREYEKGKCNLSTVASVFSSLHLIEMKDGGAIEWMGAKSMREHLKSIARPIWTLKRCRQVSNVEATDSSPGSDAKRLRKLDAAAAAAAAAFASEGDKKLRFSHCKLVQLKPQQFDSNYHEANMQFVNEIDLLRSCTDSDQQKAGAEHHTTSISTDEIANSDPHDHDHLVNNVDSDISRSSTCAEQQQRVIAGDGRADKMFNDSAGDESMDWRFDPFAYLSKLFTPQQLVSLQQQNPGSFSFCL